MATEESSMNKICPGAESNTDLVMRVEILPGRVDMQGYEVVYSHYQPAIIAIRLTHHVRREGFSCCYFLRTFVLLHFRLRAKGRKI